MASDNGKRLQRALAPALKQRGFKKSGATWRKESGEAIGVFNVQGSLGELVPDRERLNTLLDFEKPVQEDVRVRELETLVVEHGLPWLDTVSTIEGAREYCSSQAPKSPWVTKEARAFLGAAHGA